jgi:NitT/TauT family transport system substrate-binding protein
MIRKSCAFALAAALATAAPSAGLAEQNAKTSIRLSLNPLVYAHLPVMMAVDKGYFVQEGIEPIVTKYTGSAVTQMPLLARGDLDITGVVGGPALFNQYADGFGIKLIAANEATHDGWNDTTWVIVRKDLWDSGAIRSITDLKGRAVDAGPEGSPVNFLLNQVLKKAGLTRADVKYSTRAVSPPDWIAGFRNNAFDAVSAVEPVVTQIVEQGYGVRLTSPREIMPWWQGAYFGASQKLLQQNRAAAVRFVKAFLRSAQDIERAGPRWTTEELAILNHWSGIPIGDLQKIPSPAYVGEFGRFHLESLNNQQDYWLAGGQTKQRVALSDLVDQSIVAEARHALGVE